jgi:hypothetical protein
MQVSGKLQRTGGFIPMARIPSAHGTGGWVDPTAGLHAFLSLPGIEPQFRGCPARSLVTTPAELSRLQYKVHCSHKISLWNWIRAWTDHITCIRTIYTIAVSMARPTSRFGLPRLWLTSICCTGSLRATLSIQLNLSDPTTTFFNTVHIQKRSTRPVM